MDKEKVDKIIQYALAVAAGEDDFRCRELGPIHLLKYVYIADLAYAERNGGQTYTGTNWQFYKFGPWAQEVNSRIEPACLFIDAEKRTFPYKNGDAEGEGVRWKLSNTEVRDKLENDLSITVTSAVKRAVHEFGADTPRLLNYVYLTKPMLNAAPKERLDFSTVTPHMQPDKKAEKEPMTIKAQKRRTAELNEARTRIQEKLAQKKIAACARHYIRQPRYDEVYFAGQEWLDSLAGPQIPMVVGEVTFSPDIWKSSSRFDPEIP
ncbi:MAG: hypothetical protein CXR30_08895 [Geobacter sp.]|nr:MAG: hypothetical protein CXR30_08895 [Geobacter sp.]